MMKLMIELIPRSAWFNNLRNALPASGWDRLRRKTYADYNHRCGVCGGGGRLNCHERWEFDDVRHVLTLKGFIALCDLCHHVKHIGYAEVLAEQGRLDFSTVVRHFMRVNNCDRYTFQRCRDEAMELWYNRSCSQWTVDMSMAGATA